MWGSKINNILSAYCLATTTVICLLISGTAQAQPERGRNVLVINSYHPTYIWTKWVVDAIESALEQYKHGILLDIEYMDTKHFNDPEHYENLYMLYKHKAASKNYDVIIICDDNGLRFFLQYQDRLYPNVPAVFCGVQDFSESMLKQYNNMTGVIEDDEYKRTVEVAVKLHPEAKQIVCVCNEDDLLDENWVALLKDSFKSFNRPIKLVSLSPYHPGGKGQLLEKVKGLGAESIVFLACSFIDPKGHVHSFEDDTDIIRIRQQCTAPIYSSAREWLQFGFVVGGDMDAGFYQGKTAAELAMRILDGQKADDIAIVPTMPRHYVFDYIQLRRFGISLSDLPAESVVINEPESFYYKYKARFLMTIIIIIALVVVVVILTINNIRRKLIESRLKQYRFMVESASDAIFFKDLDSRYIVANNKALEAFGLSSKQVIGKSDDEIMPDKNEAKKNIEDDRLIFETNKPTETTKQMTDANGRKRWFQAVKVPQYDNNENIMGIVGIARDVTEQKKTENELLFKSTLLETQSETTTDGILVVDSEGSTILFNQRFGQVWNMPQQLLDAKDDAKMIQHVVEQINDSQQFLERIKYLYAHKEEKSRDEIFFKDGRVIDRYSSPMVSSQGKYYGRIWYFRDITEHKNAERELQKARDELDTRVRQRTAELVRTNENLRKEITEREKAERKLLDYQKQLRSLASGLSLAEECMRRQIATDVHDHIGQNLAISKIKLESLSKSAPSGEFAETLAEIGGLIAQTINSSRSLTFELSPPVLYELGFEAAMEWLLRQTRQQHGLSTEFRNDEQKKPMHNDVQVLLFQAVRELLINVAKHANAKNVIVSTRRADNQIEVSVEDDGIGFDTLQVRSPHYGTDGFGLFNIRERLGHIGGHFELESKHKHGTRVTLAAPIDLQNEQDREKGQ